MRLPCSLFVPLPRQESSGGEWAVHGDASADKGLGQFAGVGRLLRAALHRLVAVALPGQHHLLQVARQGLELRLGLGVPGLRRADWPTMDSWIGATSPLVHQPR